MENKACVAQHSTAWMAGQFAWAIKAKSLVLTHFSARYEGSQRDTAKATFGAAGGTGYVSEGENEERAHQALKREHKLPGFVMLGCGVLWCQAAARHAA
jgi:hypothetical protein